MAWTIQEQIPAGRGQWKDQSNAPYVVVSEEVLNDSSKDLTLADLPAGAISFHITAIYIEIIASAVAASRLASYQILDSSGDVIFEQADNTALTANQIGHYAFSTNGVNISGDAANIPGVNASRAAGISGDLWLANSMTLRVINLNGDAADDMIVHVWGQLFAAN